jgi:hypothetical protein
MIDPQYAFQIIHDTLRGNIPGEYVSPGETSYVLMEDQTIKITEHNTTTMVIAPQIKATWQRMSEKGRIEGDYQELLAKLRASITSTDQDEVVVRVYEQMPIISTGVENGIGLWSQSEYALLAVKTPAALFIDPDTGKDVRK